MKALKIFLYIIICGITLAFNAANAETLSAQNDKVAVSIYTQYRQINDVKNFSVLIKFQLLNGWHIAWDNAGDAGTPTKFSWQAPKDISIARLNESVPEKFLYGGIPPEPYELHTLEVLVRKLSSPENLDFKRYLRQLRTPQRFSSWRVRL